MIVADPGATVKRGSRRRRDLRRRKSGGQDRLAARGKPAYHGAMNHRTGILIALAAAVALAVVARAPARAEPASATPPPQALPPPTTVDHVDLQRYLGRWYEIARIPNRFQKQCASNATAEYELRRDGTLTVTNACLMGIGKEDVAHGVAKIVDRSTNARLKVSFVSFLGVRPFWGDYWIIGLDPDYRWAVVGTPSRRFGWVLARTPTLDPAAMETVYGILEQSGYKVSAFETSPQ